MKKIFKIIKPEHLLIVALLEIAAFTHAYNMFNFPYYENDEGTYMSQAWAVVAKSSLAPYTYWYDHAPAGWMFISLWSLVSGGFFTFGFSVNSGRVLMLIIHVASAFFLYFITKRYTNSKFAAAIAVLLFSLSPLAIYFQRRVLLDNIMTFWVLGSIYALSKERVRLGHVIVSALLFGIAILSKENAIFFIPGFIALLFVRLHKSHRLFVMAQWGAIVLSIISVYFLFALLKGEFFPYGSALGGDQPHVSLIETLRFQSSRSNGGSVLDISKGQFWHELSLWIKQDRLLIFSGIAGMFGLALLALRKRIYLSFLLFNLCMWVFLARGGTVIEFYILPLVPFMGFAAGAVLSETKQYISKYPVVRWMSVSLQVLVLIGLGSYYYAYGAWNRGYNIYTSNQTKAQIEAVDWIRKNVSSDSIFIVDNYGYIDLKATDNPSKRYFKHAEWYLKIDSDVEVKSGILGDTPSNIDIIAMTPQTNHDIKNSDLKFVSTAVDNASRVKVFWSDGWGVEFWTTKYPRQALERSWESYKTSFVSAEGRSIDPQNSYVTTSELQGYTLLRSVWMNDQQTFDIVWKWTKEHMQMRNSLFGWQWSENERGAWELTDRGTHSGADTDIALSLLFASKHWGDDSYKQEAMRIIDGIWNNEVKTIDDTPYLIAADWLMTRSGATINPSYLSPYAYRIFAQVNPENDWMKLVDSTYAVIESCTNLTTVSKSSITLLPDWCTISPTGKAGVSTEKEFSSTNYGYYSQKVPWKLALDYKWNKEERAKKYLSENSFIKDEWTKNAKISMSYTMDGKSAEGWESVTGYAGALGNFVVTDPMLAADLYSLKIASTFYQDEYTSAYWEDPDNVYTQNWGWFGTGLYSNNIPNLWAKSSQP